ncbi:hypothetical protein CW711_06775 [Candidatus Bathyarchaeota archaeon]|nr:MAG: hypothetical protein CW711_06775 [Candidatus Bathyarchaeota archaeon]RLG98446.1 MAG: hypothetical protein DRO29_00895 [Candidatus Bathyarchaeota archaeon]
MGELKSEIAVLKVFHAGMIDQILSDSRVKTSITLFIFRRIFGLKTLPLSSMTLHVPHSPSSPADASDHYSSFSNASRRMVPSSTSTILFMGLKNLDAAFHRLNLFGR